MRARSFAVLALALVLAGFSVFLARSWLQANMPGTVVSEPTLRTTTVVVARVPLYFGNQLTAENLRVIEWPADNRPEGTFTTLDEILREGERRVVLRPIEADEPILAAKVSGFGGRATLSSVIADDMRAMTIRVNDVHGVAGFVLPGDRVDILITREPDKDSPITDILLQNVQVLGIDQDANEKRDKPQVARAVTLEVTPEQAQKLTLASTVGTLSLSLRNLLNTDAVAQRSITLKDLRIGEVNGEDKPQVQAAPAPVRANPGIEVRVVRGLAATSQRVLPDAGAR
ncbi:Flp pilus assembly protein CpaB [Novispirillum sp. DQ9]|uniref:Flp pilus assembly protein CpaB n=1 Tax=Novispirillum sp. DQ9 TaxID=3398612 RepID=UPI003C7C363B